MLIRQILSVATIQLAVATVAVAAPVTGTMTVGGRAIEITDVSAVAMTGGADDPAWQLVFSEQEHSHDVEGQKRALRGEHGLAFAVEVLASGEGHNFVIYQLEPDGMGPYPSSFPWPQVSGFNAGEGRLRGTLSNNPDFPYQDIVFALDFDAPIVSP